MKRAIVGLFIALAAFCAHAQAVPTVRAKSVIVMDATTNEILLSQNETDIRSIASITKLMTAFVTVDSKLDMDEVITISDEDVDGTRLRGFPTSGSIFPGMKFTRAELLHLALMNSQNRAAHALARSYPGGKPMFVAIMNTTAAQLGMTHTTYIDPTGLMSGNQSTVGDLSLLIKAAAEMPMIRDFSTSTSFKTTQYFKKKERSLSFGSTNKLVAMKGWNVILQKTGYINDAGRCMVMLTTIAARDVIIVVLGADEPRARTADMMAIKYWLENGDVASAGQLAAMDPVRVVLKAKRRARKV